MATALILFGFVWMVVAALIGLLLARRHELAQVQLEEIAAKGKLIDYHRVDAVYKWNKTVHAHAFLFSIVAVLIGLALSRMNYPEAVTDVLAGALMVAVAVWTLGGLRSNRPLMVIGDLTLLVSVMVAAIGMARAL